jgi:hypothetical protein
MFDDFIAQIQSDEFEHQFLAWCELMEEVYGKEN